ncbi:MAG: type III-A CRISPR-associated protein Csm2 [Candidatus Omnitrophica bacterium 4484_70.1]|nr:MAG: type III-A CRISPR-associated protein Csm2 [Candidatus Omnitrophica bacterium 4484_70.1]
MENEEKKEFKKCIIDDRRFQKIIKDKNAEELNIYAKDLGEILRYPLWIKKDNKVIKEKELSTSQIRHVLDEIQRMQKFDRGRLQLLRPKLAYIAGRHGGRVKEFQQIVDKAIDLVDDEKDFEFFKNFIEAIVAYHRYYGGK